MNNISKKIIKENYRKFVLIILGIFNLIIFIYEIINFLVLAENSILILAMFIIWLIITIIVLIASFKLPVLYIFPLKDINEFISNISFLTINEHEPWIICYGDLKKHGLLKRKGSHYDKNIAVSIFKEFNQILPDKDIILKSDIDISQEELIKNNLILLGGPLSNEIIYAINQMLPVQLVKTDKFGLIDKGLYSIAKEKVYYSRTIGVFEIIKNPWNKNKLIVILMGLHREGVKVASTLFINFKNLKLNKYNSKIPAKIAELRKNVDDSKILNINDLIEKE